jgi:hypothetical protein
MRQRLDPLAETQTPALQLVTAAQQSPTPAHLCQLPRAHLIKPLAAGTAGPRERFVAAGSGLLCLVHVDYVIEITWSGAGVSVCECQYVSLVSESGECVCMRPRGACWLHAFGRGVRRAPHRCCGETGGPPL